MGSSAETRPVIIGVGEITDRPTDPLAALDPVGLMAEAARRAQTDAGVHLLNRIDSVDIVHQVSWRYEDTAAALCDRLSITPRRAVYSQGGGERPLERLYAAARRIAGGSGEIALICGGEARHAARKARQAGIDLPWSARAKRMENPWDVSTILSPMAIAHGITDPVHIYPFYENACAAAWGQTSAQAQAESATLWAELSATAAGNQAAWARRALSAHAIATVSPDNPLIAWPYTRAMVANPTVNQGAALLLTSEAQALALGVQREKLVYLAGGAAAAEPRDFLCRDTYHHSPAQEVVLDAALVLADGIGPLGAVELYSCFPCVPKMARHSHPALRALPPSVTGGLSFFGGPFNNYMAHATAAMVRRIRDGLGLGLLYGQGEFVTKHQALLLAADATGWREPAFNPQARADARRGPVPPVVDQAEGAATLETHTVIYDRSGAPAFGAIIARTANGARTLARLPSSDSDGIHRLTDWQTHAIGARGRLAPGADSLLEWSFT